MLKAIRLAVCFAVAWSAVGHAWQRPAVDPRGTIAGLVIRPDGSTWPGVIVSISALTSFGEVDRSRPRIRTTADVSGRFIVTNVVPGAYALGIEQFSYAGQAFGDPKGRLPDVLIEVSGGEHLKGIVLKPPVGISVQGSLSDSSGQPVLGGQVLAIRQLHDELVVEAGATTTSDGGFLLAGLPADDYWILSPHVTVSRPVRSLRTASKGGGLCEGTSVPESVAPAVDLPFERLLRHPMLLVDSPVTHGGVFGVDHPSFPAMANGEWPAPLRMSADSARRNIDLSAISRPAVNIDGVVKDEDGVPYANCEVRLLPWGVGSGPAVQSVSTAIAYSDSSGRFRAFAVPIGRFTASVVHKPRPAAETPRWALTEFFADSSSGQLELVLKRGRLIRGRLMVEAGTVLSVEDVQKSLQLSLTNEAGGSVQLQVPTVMEDSSTFVLGPVPDGIYRVKAQWSGARPFAAEFYAADGRQGIRVTADITDSRIILAELDARIRLVAPQGSVLGRRFGFIKRIGIDSSSTGDRGDLRLLQLTSRDRTLLVPVRRGEYLVGLVPEGLSERQVRAWSDAEWRRSGAQPVRLSAGETRELNIK